jgi:DNA-binding MarR family transcriptional regulator
MATNHIALVPKPGVSWLNNLTEAVDILREVHPDMTLNQVLVLLLVALKQGTTQREVMEQIGVSDSSTSRIVALLSSYGNRGTGPFHLIDLSEDPQDRRTKHLHLTKRGQALVDRLTRVLARGHK